MDSTSPTSMPTTDAPGQTPRISALKSIFIVSSGNFLEMYDFMVFGYYARQIGHAYFRAGSEVASILLTLMTFGAGFLMRPVGALVLGAYIDRHGRRRGLLLTLLLMGCGTLTIACLPGYATIGMAAPLLILTGRLVQGLSAGVEVGGVSVYLSEIATPGRVGFYVSWQSASQQAAVVFAALIGFGLNLVFSDAQIDAFGWRIPFFIGSALLPFLFVLRSHMAEPPRKVATAPDLRAFYRAVGSSGALIACAAAMAIMTTVFFYMITAYTPTYAGSVLHLGAADAMLVTCCVGLANFVLLPAMGALSDRIGRRPLLLGASVVAVGIGYPALHWLVASPSMARLLTVELVFALVYATYNGAMIAYMAEVIPARIRTAGFSLAYSLATAIFGGFTPALATWLIAATGNKALPGAWLSVAALLSFLAVLALGGRRMTAASR